MRRILLSLVLLLSFAGAVAHADDVVYTYTLTNFTTTSGASITGTVSIDVTTGQFTGIDASYVGNGFNDQFNGPSVGQYSTNTGPDQFYRAYFDATIGNEKVPGGADIVLILPGQSLVDFPPTGSAMCPAATACPNFEPSVFLYDGKDPSAIDGIETGCLNTCNANPIPVNPSPTPEPSSLVLLGTGVLGLAGAVRRRLRR